MTRVMSASANLQRDDDNERRQLMKPGILGPGGSKATEGCRGSMPER